MGKKTDEKILDEIRRRVIELDQQRKEQKKQNDIKTTNVEVLSDITSLSKTEINEIAIQVQEEFEKKQHKKRKIIMWGLFIFAIICFVVLLRWYFAKNRFHFVETFENNKNGWSIAQTFDTHRYFKDGKYIFDNNVSSWCYWDNVLVTFPAKYSIELTSIWQSGKNFDDEYGFILVSGDKDYQNFVLCANGAVTVSQHVGEDWTTTLNWNADKAHKGETERPNIQRVDINGKNYQYFVNNILVREGTIAPIVPTSIALRVCGVQKVAFSHLKIVDLTQKDKIIFEESFNPPTQNWNPKKVFERSAAFENGKYVFAANKIGYCLWNDIPLENLESMDFDITLTSQWIEGNKENNYGISFLEDDNNYISFEFQANGKARYIISHSGSYSDTGTDINTNIFSTGKEKHKQIIKIRGKKFEYYVNDVFVSKGKFKNIDIRKIGVRVCGKQTVAFDELIIDEK